MLRVTPGRACSDCDGEGCERCSGTGDLIAWPTEAVIIVASIPARAQRAKMESVNHGVCRDCGREILFDGYTFARASRPELTHGRPVEFLCLEYCFQHYDFEQATIRENHTPEFKAAHPG